MTKRIIFLSILTSSISFLFSCVGIPRYDKVCPFVEYGNQIFATYDGFFLFSIKEYKGNKERLLIKFFDKEGRQLSGNEIDYPFSFYNFLIRQRDKESVFLISQNRQNSRQNLILVIARDCQKVAEYKIDAKNFETVSDIITMDSSIFVGGWVESKNAELQKITSQKKGFSKIVVEHDMWLEVYDTNFTSRLRLVKGDDSAEYIFSLTPSGDKSRLYYTGSIMNFEISPDNSKILKSTSFFIKEADVLRGDYESRVAEYSVSNNLIPFFIQEYDEKDLLLVLMGKKNNVDYLGIGISDKERLNVNLNLYPVYNDYLAVYPVITNKDYVILKLYGIKTDVMDKILIIDNKMKSGLEVKIDGINRMGLRLEGEDLDIFYSLTSKPCNESITAFTKIPLKSLIERSKIQVKFTNGISYRDLRVAEEITLKKKD
ncbi:MAG: hypothetical protein ACP5QK_00930 [Myxococcota bacterium]